MIHYFSLRYFLLSRKSFLFLKKILLDITIVLLALLFKQPNKANFYNMELALESFFFNVLLCKVQQLPKKKENNQYKRNTSNTITSFEKKVLSLRLKQICLSILISPNIGNIQIGIAHLSLQSSEDINFKHFKSILTIQNTITLVMIKFGMKLKSSSFLELSSVGKISDVKYKKTEEKSQVNVYTINTMIFGM
ncbi:hypothetical protein RFI_40307 [Reticulomyxa filosa]|uniref:Uncharacterized protein n=1 Tax=Reticulomyxa filosa TaxID=46433 RepID=X6L909_RETFI|nr:hypothetical protein RFI_40307 [Reticulomyxa filosa]|eukprot:ETN97224.1 hypothetical protein RFI_40307 [Reticulomyxa filosa]